MTETISVLVLTHDRLEQVKACFESLVRVRPAFENLIVVDNASVDGTEGYVLALPKLTPSAYVWGYGDNLGVARGRQELVKLATRSAFEDILLFLDSDAIVHSAALFDTIRAAFEDEAVGVVGIGGSYVDWNQDHPFVPAPVGKCDVVQGWCMAVRRELFSAVAFDTEYGKFWEEDSDLCMQARKAGFDVVSIDPAGSITHHPGSSGAHLADRQQTLARFRMKWQGLGLTKAEGGYR